MVRQLAKKEREVEHEPLKKMVGLKARQIWDAYQEVLAELKAKELAPSTVAVAEAKKVGDALAAANSTDISAVLAHLDQLSKGVKDAEGIFINLKTAIDAKKAELKEVHSLEAEVNSLVAVVQAKDLLVKDREQKAQVIIEEAKQAALDTMTQAHKNADDLALAAAEKSKAAEKERQRVAEEWEYAFNRDKRAKLDAVGDEIAKKIKALQERETAVATREAAANTLDAKIKDLETQLTQVEAKTLSRIADAVTETKAEAARSAAVQKSIIDGAHKADMAVLQAENKSLKDQLLDLRARLDRAESQVQSANDRVTAIATGALKAGADAATVAKVAEVAAGSGSKK